MPETTDFDLANFVSYALIPCIVALAGVIGALWRHQVKQQERTQKKLDDCQEAHHETTKELVGLSGRVGHLEGKLEGRIEGMHELAKAVIDESRRAA